MAEGRFLVRSPVSSLIYHYTYFGDRPQPKVTTNFFPKCKSALEAASSFRTG
jgi:hypothetical protein